MSRKITKFLALLMAAVLLFSTVGCVFTPADDTLNDTPPVQQETTPAVQLSAPDKDISDELTREEKEEIVQILGDGKEDVSSLPDEKLDEIVDELIEQLEKEEAPKTDATIDVDEDAYDEDGSMNQPFDQVYPELIEKEEVVYDDETLLIKLRNSQNGTITDGMKAVGVAALEAIVPMEEYTWYEAKLIEGTDANVAIEALRALPEVVLVEYNYQIQTAAIDNYKELPGDKGFDNNKHHDDQWYMHHCGIPDGYGTMQTGGGSSSVIVAVIDTGVDYDHEDLAQNIWFNAGEIPDDGRDNDGNGYVDDYYGINLITGRGSADDDNGHGTHVAGIIAAQNNNLGTVGIAYNVKIMPIKAAMASGYLHQSDIAKAILYAYENGAEVINMSFGGTACSIAVQDALAVAYTRCVLVASAGNSGMPNEGLFALPNYPAALTYVLGVMSVDQNGVESAFTNYDLCAFNSIEYELYAPGSSIMSTLPDNRYGILSGTSMAAPVVAAMAAILRSEFTDRDIYPTKFIYGQLAATSDYSAICCNPDSHGAHNLPSIVDLHAALTKLPKPEIHMQDYALFDTAGLPYDSGSNNGDGVIDAGEVFALGFTLRNRWGMGKNVTVTMDTLSFAGIPDPYITILTDEVNYGSVGTYSTQDAGQILTDGLLTGWENPFYIKIAKDCPNDYIFTLNVKVTAENALDENDASIYTTSATVNLTVRNGVVLPSVIEEDMVLTPDNLYIIPNSTTIQPGVTVRVLPGTHIQFWSDDEKDPYADNYIAFLRVDGNFFVEGTKENPVYIYPSDLRDRYQVEIGEKNDGCVVLMYADITNYGQGYSSNVSGISYAYGCTFRKNYGTSLYYRYVSGGTVYDSYGSRMTFPIDRMENCVFYMIGNYEASTGCELKGIADKCIFVDSHFYLDDYAITRDCVFLGNYFEDQTSPGNIVNSSLQLSGSTFYVAPQFAGVYYRPETGTTYVSYYRPETNAYLLQQYVKTLGGDYAVIETKDELDWLDAALPYLRGQSAEVYYDLGITYNWHSRAYVWADGTAVPDFLQKAGVTDAYPSNNENYALTLRDGALASRSLINGGTSYGENGGFFGPYVLYEIPGEIYLTDITLPEYEIVLDSEQTYQISAAMEPAIVPMDKLIFVSSDESVITVSESGLITPVGVGSTDVYVYSHDKALYTYLTVEVREPKALLAITMAKQTGQVAIGENLQVKLNLIPADTTKTQFAYTSSNPGVAVVDEHGMVTGISSGTATITARYGELSASMEVTVYRKATSLAPQSLTAIYSLTEEAPQLPALVLSEGAEADLYWRSTNVAVADVVDGKLVLNSLGNTVVQITDVRSGLETSVEVTVIEQALSPMFKIQTGYYHTWGLTEDGKLYYWNPTNAPIPVLKAENVADFDADRDSDSTAYCVGKDGSLFFVSSYAYSEPYPFQQSGLPNAKPVDFAVNIPDRYTTDFFILYETGHVYVFGSNYYGYDFNTNGNYGVGSNSSVLTPTLINLDDVVEIETTSSASYFLTTDNKLYYAGGDVNVPTLMAENVTELTKPNDSVYFKMDGYWYRPGSNGSKYLCVDEPGLTAVVNQNMYLKDGVVYYNGSPVTGIDTAIAMTDGYDARWGYIATADGMLWGIGQYYGDSAVNIPLFSAEGAVLNLESTNLRDGMLTENGLVLDFNEPLTEVLPQLYAGDQQITVNTSINLDRVTFTHSKGFQEGMTYKLIIPMQNLQTTTGLTLTEDLTITFTYDPAYGVQTVTVTDIQTDSTPEIRRGVFVLLSDGRLMAYESKWNAVESATCLLENVVSFDMENINVSKMATVLALLEDGTIIALGGELPEPMVIDDFVDMDAAQISFSYGRNYGNGLFVLLSDGTVYTRHLHLLGNTCACNSYGQLGMGDNFEFGFDGWKKVLIDEPVKQVEAAADITYFLTQSGRLYVAGGTELNAVTPVLVDTEVVNVEKNGTYLVGSTVKFFHSWSTEPVVTTSTNALTMFNQSGQDLTVGVYEQSPDTIFACGRSTDGETEDFKNFHISMPMGFTDPVAIGGYTYGDFNYTYFASSADGRFHQIEDTGEILTIELDTKDAASEEVIRESVLDGSDRFYWDTQKIVDKFYEIHDTLQYDPNFLGNVILNRFTTDTNVNHWLRALAPSVGNYTEVPLGGNYWGTTNETAIGLQIVDYTDFTNYARVMYMPYLTAAPENTFPFVTGVTILNKAGEEVFTVGNEEITIRITFNRDMDTTIPLMVRFGSAYPYGDYEISGQFVEPRTWEGVYTLKTIIENGYHFFTIGNGRTADGEMELYTDWARFHFEIDTTAAQALIMQGHAEDTGIRLSWTQDDFDTLMGYNVYRSNAEDGYYTRLNSSVIPADTMTFFDETVEPGTVYYYNFTVVKTDLTESEPSGKITLMSKDTMAPNIYHSPVTTAMTGTNLIISATVTDNLTIAYADVYYRTVGETEWKLVRMNKLNDKYSAILPAHQLTTAGIEYYIDAFDGVSHTYKGTAETPFVIQILEAVEQSSLGDVDGDGTITNRDALILLYAINDKYNMTAEEFARADLNGDGELWAAEALRILQYVSGAVGSVTMP